MLTLKEKSRSRATEMDRKHKCLWFNINNEDGEYRVTEARQNKNLYGWRENSN
jgi:hypothetical protein